MSIFQLCGDNMEGLLTAFAFTLHPAALALMLVGVSAGVFVGAIPGLTGTMLIALCLPLTFFMTPEMAIVLLISIYIGAISGGLITATLLKMPGTEAAIMTTLDGYPMARAGKPGRALGLGIGSSFIGGLISWIALVVLTKPLSVWATKFTAFNYFALIVMALVLIAIITEGSFLKGIAAALIGALLAMPGIDPSSGTPRLTFGLVELNGGIDPVPMFIGLFALGTVFSDILLGSTKSNSSIEASRKGILMGLRDYRQHGLNLLRSSVIGTWIGLLPGVGAVIGSMVAYSAAKGVSKTPERFGTGCEEGIVASESANNATIGGAMIPLIALGLPGSLNNVLLLAALLIHSVQPGPLLFVNNAEIVYILMAAFFVSNVLMYLVMILSVRWVSKISEIPQFLLFPLIIVFCLIGGFAYGNSVADVWVLLGFAVLGFVLDLGKFPKGPLAISFILAPMAEQKLRSGLQLSGGDWSGLWTEPLTLIMLLIALVMLFSPFLGSLLPRVKRHRQGTQSADPTEE
ncbi:tripartite tricarboxylate transporter permease [Marinobacterium rhizophilum]|uniref:Tripartite tricarboxylate transporter permease n=1 Tax=Marinobacterium rhizophilum TaxID=420402 RepID=A0ABY5HGC7_9GAMM|nr:tripartite tricarboxylate transporter permease [Marinobacterium rhizophilum]UTW11412.1 tripartite tricarboxylate transporter permease [Marinobacterium rhizophilum]